VDTLGSNLIYPITALDVGVSLLDATGAPLVSWRFVGAFPVRVEVSPLHAMESRIVIETLELSYRYFERTPPGPAGAAG
jgi:phage tail-like protein